MPAFGHLRLAHILSNHSIYANQRDMVSSSRQLPDEPLAFIQTCVRQRRILWTYHVNMRLQHRHIGRQAILDAIDTYEVIETYPEDKYLPSYLVLARHKGEAFHVLFATDAAEENVRIITAYRPSLDEWETDLKSRRTTQ